MSNATRATHHGTCQLCGQNQLLPGGRLSNHGYAVLWSQFVGVCPGSKGLPYEQSTDLIEDSIRRHEHAAAALRSHAADLRTAAPEGNVIPLHVYVPATWEVRKSSYRWTDAEVAVEDRGTHLRFTVTVNDRVEDLTSRYGMGYGVKTLAEVVRWARGKRADALEAEAKHHDRYVAWQRARIAGWQPAELRPRKEA